MQIDQPERGFSFQADGPLDMRMGSLGLLELDLLKTAQARVEAGNTQASTSDKLTHQSEDRDSVVGSPPNIGLPNVGAQKENVGAQEASAADVVNTYEEADIAAILYHLGEERRSRAIAKAIVARRAQQLFTRTLDLANLVAKVLGRGPPGKNPATRTFQALRMYVNDELGQLVKGLAGAERALKPGGRLVVVTFHSLEDRIVKRFISSRSGKSEGVSRHMPPPDDSILPPSFQIINLRSLTSSKAELESNPRARSARLRFAVRTDADPWPVEAGDLGMPKLDV
ncbi:MAG: 16S rRNA (cytosine(1402)-N(4))-methyltransferase RsmH [Alphaproteobacteria bacterium]|nr:16S rRNA (cytosine(1402)-N(4))-methyltransferase RsmH [Alphaproteobacteria bacterium]